MSTLGMTRKQVADRLGRSLATVRRLEGALLHPHRDARGVHHFDRDEVEALAHDLIAGRISLGREQEAAVDDREWPLNEDGPRVRNVDLRPQVDALTAELETLRRSHRREIEALQAESERTERRLRGELAEMEREIAEFVLTVESALA